MAETFRALADLLDAHPDWKVNDHVDPYVLLMPETVDDARRIVRELGGGEKEFSDHTGWVNHKVGLGHISVCFDREEVCTRRVIGQKTTVKKVPVAFEEREVIEDIVEWECGPLMAPSA